MSATIRSRCRPRCAICGTHVYRDDAIGFTGNRLAHAECALIRWLGSPPPDPRADPPASPDGEQDLLLRTLLREK